MPIDPNGSKPEKLDIPGQETYAQNYTASEVEHLPGINKWRPKKKIGLPDQKQRAEAFRRGYEAIDWSKKLEVIDGQLVVSDAEKKEDGAA